MKRWIVSFLAAVLVLTAMAAPVFAAAPWRGQNFADADGDGICDNREDICPCTGDRRDGHGYGFRRCRLDDNGGRYLCASEKRCPRFTDENSDGICDNRNGSFTDENGDGICDNRNGSFTDENGDGICDNRNGSFTDENGDGICDNRGCNGGNQGEGRGRCRGRNR